MEIFQLCFTYSMNTKFHEWQERHWHSWLLTQTHPPAVSEKWKRIQDKIANAFLATWQWTKKPVKIAKFSNHLFIHLRGTPSYHSFLSDGERSHLHIVFFFSWGRQPPDQLTHRSLSRLPCSIHPPFQSSIGDISNGRITKWAWIESAFPHDKTTSRFYSFNFTLYGCFMSILSIALVIVLSMELFCLYFQSEVGLHWQQQKSQNKTGSVGRREISAWLVAVSTCAITLDGRHSMGDELGRNREKGPRG